jgi:hypothetical protein
MHHLRHDESASLPLHPFERNSVSPFKIAGVRDLLERIAALDCVERVIPGRMAHVGGGGGLRLTDSGMPAGKSGRKYTLLAHGTSMELFLVPGNGRQADLDVALRGFPEYVVVGNARRAAEEAAAEARAARIVAARAHHGPRPRHGRPTPG